MIGTLEDLVLHPVTVLSAGAVSLAHVLHLAWLDAFFAVIWGNLAPLFTAVSISAFTVVPNVDLGVLSPLSNTLQVTAIALGVAYAGKLAYGVYKEVQRKL